MLLTLFPGYAKFSVETKGDGLGGFGGSESINAWHEWALLGVLLVVAAFVIVVLRVVTGTALPPGVPWNLVTAAAAGLGTIILLIYPFTFGPDVPSVVQDSIDVSRSPGWSGWLLLVAAIVFTVFSFLAFKESGEKIPEVKRNDPPPAPSGPPAPPAG
ncbi:MAG: hypothetical protein JWR27_2015 [Aeromicrobium sp.]|nr:hypothetical protein [Aeromicrobium sp.]